MGENRGFVTAFALVVLVLVSIYTTVILNKASSYVRLMNISMGKVALRTKDKVMALSVLNVALASVRNARLGDAGTIYVPVRSSAELMDFLNEWRDKARMFPGEGDMWDGLYDSIVDHGVGTFMENYDIYSTLMNALEGNGVIENASTVEAAVFKTESNGGIYRLVVVKYGDTFRWATFISRTLNQYLMVTNSERTRRGDPIYYVTGDVIDGPLYTTDEINIYGDPVFKGTVEAAGINMVPGSNPVFENGYTIIDEPDFVLDEDFADSVISGYRDSTKDITEISNGDVTGVYLTGSRDYRIIAEYVDENTTTFVIFRKRSRRRWQRLYTLTYDSTPLNTDGTMNATLTNLRTLRSVSFKFNGIVLSQSDLYVSDTGQTSFFSGLLTLASEDDIYVLGNVVYSHLRTGPNSFVTDTSRYNELSEGFPENKLNLVAYNDVIMSQNVPRNLYITSSVYALTGEFTLQNYNRWWVVKDTLHVFGSIAQKYRGPIGTFGWWWSTGFDRKDYIYDKRLFYGPYPFKTPTMGGRLRVLDIR